MPDQDAAAARPRYQAIADELTSDILGGNYAVGTMMPTEHELCDRFDVSRYTVREALRRLREMGLVSMRRGSGTMVLNASAGDTYVQSVDSMSELVQYPADTVLHVVRSGIVAVDKSIAAILRCDPGTEWFLLSGIRMRESSETPICWTDFYLAPAFADVIEGAIEGRRAFHKEIERVHGVVVAKAELQMFADHVDDGLAGHLKVEPGSPAMTIIRRYNDRDARNSLTTISIHPEGRFIYSMELQRDWRTRD